MLNILKLHQEIKQKSKKQSKESQLPSKSEGCNERYGFRGNCDSQGKLGMCPSLAEPISSGFSKSHVSQETIRNPLQLFPRNSCKITAYCFWEMGWYFGEKGEKNEPQATKKFFDPAIFQKCWRGSGRVALIAARRQRNPCAMLLAHGAGGEKSDSFSRRGEQDRSAL